MTEIGDGETPQTEYPQRVHTQKRKVTCLIWSLIHSFVFPRCNRWGVQDANISASQTFKCMSRTTSYETLVDGKSIGHLMNKGGSRSLSLKRKNICRMTGPSVAKASASTVTLIAPGTINIYCRLGFTSTPISLILVPQGKIVDEKKMRPTTVQPK